MKDRRKSIVDIREILMQLRAKVSQRQIAQEQQIHRKTVKRYEKWAQKQGLLAGELPGLSELQALLKKNDAVRGAPASDIKCGTVSGMGDENGRGRGGDKSDPPAAAGARI